MTQPINSTSSTGNQQVNNTNPSILQRGKDGFGAIRTTIASVEWRAGGASLFHTVVRGPISWLWSKITGVGSWVIEKVYGPARIVTETVEIEKKGWFGSVYTEKLSLDYALENKLITREEALSKKYCDEQYLTARGYDMVKFTYPNWRYADCEFEGTLRSALQGRYIKIEEAISQKFITREQAVEGGFLKVENTETTTK